MHPIADIVKHVIEVVDVDGVVRKIDVNDVVERIDVDALVQRVDLNKAIATIDWNTQLERIDMNKVLNRIDTNTLLARSSSGIFTTFLDTLRLQVTMIDLYLRIVTRCRVWQSRSSSSGNGNGSIYLPPAPGRHRQRDDREAYPKGRTNKAVAVQGRYSGFVSKAVAILLDIFIITIMFALIFRVVEWCLILFLGTSQDEAKTKTENFQKQGNIGMVLLYCIFWFNYFFLAVGLAGQTIGMAIVGLKMCNCNRTASPYSTVSMKQAFLRTCVLPLTVTLFPPLGVIGLIRRDGRMLHDLVADTGMIYLWDAKLAKLRSRALRRDQEGSVFSDDDASDELDEILEDNDGDGDSMYYESTNAVDNMPRFSNREGQEVLLRQGNFNSSDQYSTFDRNGRSNSDTKLSGNCHII